MLKNLVAKLKENFNDQEIRNRIKRLVLLGFCFIWVVFVFVVTETVDIPNPSKLEPLVGIEPPVEVVTDVTPAPVAPSTKK